MKTNTFQGIAECYTQADDGFVVVTIDTKAINDKDFNAKVTREVEAGRIQILDGFLPKGTLPERKQVGIDTRSLQLHFTVADRKRYWEQDFLWMSANVDEIAVIIRPRGKRLSLNPNAAVDELNLYTTYYNSDNHRGAIDYLLWECIDPQSYYKVTSWTGSDGYRWAIDQPRPENVPAAFYYQVPYLVERSVRQDVLNSLTAI